MSNEFGVKHFFSGSSVLVTGATGFLGKVIVEKLLRSCPEVKNVYILIRQKKGCTIAEQRLEHLLKNSIFDRIKHEYPAALKKIIPIAGDIGTPSLSLNQTDRNVLTSNVSVVMHAAATVKFNEALETAMQLNVNGLRRILELCREMKQLKSLVYISTAYSNCDRSTIDEKLYPPPEGAEEILKYYSDETVKTEISETVYFSKFVENSRPNTYSYTKALAEHVLQKEGHDLPVCIVRPSVVTATWREPVAGWVDNVNNATGLFLGVGLGALRVLLMDPSKVLNLVPVDVVANVTLCAAWETAINWNLHDGLVSDRIKIYNCCMPKDYIKSNKEIVENSLEIARTINPTSKGIWYPNLHLTTSKFSYKLEDFLFQYLPAFVVDIFSPGLNALKAYKKFKCVTGLLQHFTMNEWSFPTNNITGLKERLCSDDRTIFYLDMENIDWKKYICLGWIGIRKYILKENDITLGKARNRMNRFYWAHFLLKLAGMIIFIWSTLKFGSQILPRFGQKALY